MGTPDVEALESEVVDLCETLLKRLGQPRLNGYIAAMDLDTRKAGERLVELGLWQAHPRGSVACQFYRPLMAQGSMRKAA